MSPGRIEEELKVGVSNYISPLCYSILKLEPYNICEHSCIYCYARWYRWRNKSASKPWLPGLLEKVFKKLSDLDLKIPPFRLSTLIDPLQPLESEKKLSLKIMKLCIKYRIPLILNTKSTLFAEQPWRDLLEELGSRGLSVLQVSLSSLRNDAADVIEPGAPSPLERIDAVRRLSEAVPTVIRLQPIIPGVLEREIDLIEEVLSNLKPRQVTVEFLRESGEGLEKLYRLIGVRFDNNLWIDYGIEGEGLLRPAVKYREKALTWLRMILGKLNIPLATCKEGLFHLQDVGDCCGIRFLDPGRVARRLTLYEVWRSGGDVGKAFEEASRSGEIIFGERLSSYPNPVRKIMRAHENRLLKILDNKHILSKVCPALEHGTTSTN